MGMHYIMLVIAALLGSLVAGFLFAFAVVVMPGIRTLGDREFIRAFRAMDRIIQNNQPLFMLVWVGSVLSLAAAAWLAFGILDGPGRGLLIGALLACLLGVQLPTLMINVPLNNRLQALSLETMDEAADRAARRQFERRWNAANGFRTAIAICVSLALLVALARL